MNFLRASVLVLLVVACLLISELEAGRNRRRGRNRQNRRHRMRRYSRRVTCGGDPHAEADVKGLDNPVCFTLDNPDKKIKLFKQGDISINAGFVKYINKHDRHVTYVGDLCIDALGTTIMMTADELTIDNQKEDWEAWNKTVHRGANSGFIRTDYTGMTLEFPNKMILYVDRIGESHYNIELDLHDATGAVGLLAILLNAEFTEIKKITAIKSEFHVENGAATYDIVADWHPDSACWRIKDDEKWPFGILEECFIDHLCQT